MFHRLYRILLHRIISVPCRGSIGSYINTSIRYKQGNSTSVPCRGSIGSYICKRFTHTNLKKTSVPCRGSIGSYMLYPSMMSSESGNFRPLSGFYRFLYTKYGLNQCLSDLPSPVGVLQVPISCHLDHFHCNASPVDLRLKRKMPQIHEKTSFKIAVKIEIYTTA